MEQLGVGHAEREQRQLPSDLPKEGDILRCLTPPPPPPWQLQMFGLLRAIAALCEELQSGVTGSSLNLMCADDSPSCSKITESYVRWLCDGVSSGGSGVSAVSRKKGKH